MRTQFLRHVRCFVVAWMLLIAFQILENNKSTASMNEKPDCGSNALYLYINILGRQATFDEVDAVLPPRSRDGYSMAELATAARELGLHLEGVQLGEKRIAPDQPLISLLKDNTSGHFVVIRPVGSTGKLIQLFDPPSAPRIMEFTDLVSHPAWTGRVLRRSKSPRWRYAVGAGLILIGIMLAGAKFLRRRAEAIAPQL